MNERAIYPDALARALMDRAGQPYRPANGTEGDFFDSAFCNHCVHDAGYRAGEPAAVACVIIAKSMAFGVDCVDYPREWQYGDDGQPRCTKFQDKRVKP